MFAIHNEVLVGCLILLGLVALAGCQQQRGTGSASAGGATSGSQSFGQLSALKLNLGNGTVHIQPLPAGQSARVDWSVEPAKGPHAAPASALTLHFEERGGKLTVSEKYSGKVLEQRPQAKLTLLLPAAAEVSADLGNGELYVDSQGQVRAQVGNGELHLSGECPQGSGSVGNGELYADWLLKQGRHELQVGNGSIELGLRGGSAVDYNASAGVGAVSLSSLPGTVSRNFMNQQASGVLGAGTAKLNLSVGNGEVRLKGSETPLSQAVGRPGVTQVILL